MKQNKKLLGVWRSMRNRCYNENQKSYKYYGARGIVVSPRWLGSEGFSNFVADMGEPKPNDTIDRIDTNGNYSPENCRWITQLEQANNKRNNHNITVNGVTKTVAQWARELGCQGSAILYRLRKGMDPAEAVSKPIPKRPNSKLLEQDVLFIRKTYPDMTAQKLADKFSVSKKTVLNVLHGKIFVDVKENIKE
jgi:hypothetical protein